MSGRLVSVINDHLQALYIRNTKQGRLGDKIHVLV